jgi:hypothetical protein
VLIAVIIALEILAFLLELAGLAALLAAIWLALAAAWQRLMMGRPGRGFSMQCQYVCGKRMELCRKTYGHRGQHLPGPFTVNDPPVIGRLRADVLVSRIVRFHQGPVRWWTLRPRCPVCRTVSTGFSTAPPTTVYDSGRIRSERAFRLDPCQHEVRCYEATTPTGPARRGLSLIERGGW